MDATSFIASGEYIFLIFLRILSTFALSPIFGKNAPNMAKIILSMALSYIIFQFFPPQGNYIYKTIIEYVIACIKEISLGLILSLILVMFFSSVYAAGQIIDLQMGFSFSQLYNANTGTQTPLTGTFLNIILVLVFFAANGHHILIKIIYETFSQIPPGKASISTEMAKVIIQVFVLTFNLTLRIAMPVLVSSLLVDVLLGIVMKSIPQMNFFVVGFPVKIFMGLLVLFAFIPVFVGASDFIFGNMYSSIQKIFEEMGPVT